MSATARDGGSWDCEKAVAQMKAIGLALQYYNVAVYGLPPAPRPNPDDDPALFNLPPDDRFRHQRDEDE